MNRSHEHAAHELRLLANPSLWVCAIAAAFTLGTARAADTPDDLTPPANAASMTPKQAYQHDKDFCNSGRSTEPRAVCLKEAEHAYREARAGTLEPNSGAMASGDNSDRASTSGTSDTMPRKHMKPRHHKAKRPAAAASAADNGSGTTK